MSTGRYLLADRLVCPDGHPMHPAHRVYREYRCAECRLAVDAEMAEVVVWDRASRLRPELAKPAAPTAERADFLRTNLARARVNPGTATFRLSWQQPPGRAAARAPSRGG